MGKQQGSLDVCYQLQEMDQLWIAGSRKSAFKKTSIYSIPARQWQVMCLEILLRVDLTENRDNLGNTGVWKHQQQVIENFGKSYNEPVGNDVLPIKLVFLILGNGSVSQHESAHCLFSALFWIFMCALQTGYQCGSVCAENIYNLVLISVCKYGQKCRKKGSASCKDKQSPQLSWVLHVGGAAVGQKESP